MGRTCSQEGCEKKHWAKGLCQSHYRQRARRAVDPEVGTRKPGRKPVSIKVPGASRSKSTDTHCPQGHPWSEHTEHIDTKTGKRICRYCGYVSTAKRQQRTDIRDLESWIQWREDREEFCKRGHPREGNTRVDPKTGYRSCRKCQVDNRRKKIYGLDPDAYLALFNKQFGMCVGCLVPLDTLAPFDVHIDHCHDTGVVRGILCSSCNLGLGHLKSDRAILLRLAAYAA